VADTGAEVSAAVAEMAVSAFRELIENRPERIATATP
jgi:hypothetical protein